MSEASFYLVNHFALFVSHLLTHPPLNLPPSSSLHPTLTLPSLPLPHLILGSGQASKLGLGTAKTEH